MELLDLKIIGPFLVAILLVLLIYRIQRGIKLTVKNEVFNNFPTIKHTIDNFEHRIEFLKTELDTLERKLNELQSKH